MNFDTNYNPYPSHRSVTYGKNGMVATSQPLAAGVGLDILKKGGNAIDAAIATAACLTVVEPTSNGIGGDAFAIVWHKEQMYGLNASGPAPKGISIEGVKALGHEEKMPTFGWTPVTVPGAPAAWGELSRKFGKLPLSEVLAPAIKYATEGYPVSPVLGKNWQRAYDFYKEKMEGPEFGSWFETFAPFGRAPYVGELVKLPHHGKTLAEIGRTQGESFYRGQLADKIVSASKANGGFLSQDDLANYEPTWVTPISVNYRGYDVWELPPNGQGVVALAALNILKSYTFEGCANIDSAHKQIEAIKLAFTAGKACISDPLTMDETRVPNMLSEEFAKEGAAKIGKRALELAETPLSKGGTVYLCTADAEGNMVSYIQSNYMGFGSGIVVPETGIAMQNRGADFSLDENHANALAGGKKTYHTIIPAFITKDKAAVGAMGVMGGYMQPQGHVQVLMNMIDFNLNPQMALDAPRFQWVKDKKIEVEQQFPHHITMALGDMGHEMSVNLAVGAFGRGQIILKDETTGVYAGATESRCDGSVVGY